MDPLARRVAIRQKTPDAKTEVKSIANRLKALLRQTGSLRVEIEGFLSPESDLAGELFGQDVVFDSIERHVKEAHQLAVAVWSHVQNPSLTDALWVVKDSLESIRNVMSLSKVIRKDFLAKLDSAEAGVRAILGH